MLDRHSLVSILANLGLQATSTVIVHSAFRGLAARGWTPNVFVESLLEYVNAGHVVMPTMTWRTVNPRSPIFDELNTPGHVGIVSETFRTGFATHRSLHPTHSASAYGHMASWITGGIGSTETPCSDRSPYSRVELLGGKALLVNVGLDSCTNLHCAEEQLPDTSHFLQGESESYTCVDRFGIRHPVTIRRHARYQRAFHRLHEALAQRGFLSTARLGSCQFTLIDLAGATSLTREVLASDIKALDPAS